MVHRKILDSMTTVLHYASLFPLPLWVLGLPRVLPLALLAGDVCTGRGAVAGAWGIYYTY